MYTLLLLLFVLLAGMALGETTEPDCQSYYEINGVRTCLSSNDAPQEVPDVIGSKLESPVADPHSQVADPLFVADPRNNDSYTQAGSPAHDAALNNTESPFGGAGPDIGSRETYDEHEPCTWCGSHEHSDDEHGTPEEDD